MTTPLSLPRSFLYLPATKPHLFPKATSSGADAVVLDLEDAVPLREKDAARAHVRDWLLGDRAVGADQWVRVDADAIKTDLDAVVNPGLSGVLLAKCSTEGMRELAAVLAELESARGMTTGSIRVVGLLETARSLVDLPELARAPRLTTFGIGEVDLLADLRVTRSDRSAAAVTALRTDVVRHAAAAGLAAPVAPTSTDFADLEAFAESSRLMHDLGFRSRTAVHPRQVPVIHEVFTPTEASVAAARDLVSRFESAAGGVTTDAQGRLVDAAVVRGAREVLARSGLGAGSPDA